MKVQTSVDDGIGRLALSNPPLNILTRQVMADLRAKLAEFERDESLRVVVLGAEGKHFSAGADVGEHLPPDFEEMIPEFIDTIKALHRFPLPMIAAVRGRCLGGGFELIQAVDVVVAGEGALFGQPEIMLAVFPPVACALLPELCGPARAAELVLTGDTMGAKDAAAVGLVARVVSDERVEQEALEIAGRMAKHSAAALRVTKRALRAGSADRLREALDRAGRLYVEDLMATEDATEGLRAFLEKRRPVWKHR
ncbi:MAG: enoyl-CoA hydratase/isomerase family protein [Gemmatimonadota bacterium]|nr:MAG: enoyl-CoA hydratase/isomerase family protein [Gemmatimonadota bacterium]